MLSTESCTASPRARPFGGGASQPATRAALCSILRWRGLLLRRPTRNSSGSRPDAQASSSIISSPLISFGSTRRTARDASPHDYHRLRGGHEHVPSELRGRGCLERIAHFALLIASLPFFPRQGRRWR